MDGMGDMMDSVKLGNAMGKSDDPSPSEEFATFRREELLAYKSTCEKSGLLALEKILEGPLGFWMFTQWCGAHQSKKTKNVGKFLVMATEVRLALGDTTAKVDAIKRSFVPEPAADYGETLAEYTNSNMARPSRPALADLEKTYAAHVKPFSLSARASFMMSPGQQQLLEQSSGSWPLVGSEQLIDPKCADPATQLDALEAVVFTYCERALLPLWTNEQKNPDFLQYLRYLKIEHDEPMSLGQFNIFRTMGKGGFGLVRGCRTNTTGRMYALKEMDKKRVKKGKHFALCYQEHWALRLVDNPFCVTMKYAFQTPKKLCLIIDVMMGGDLKYHLRHAAGGRFSEDFARFYAARTLLGLEALHAAKVVYRDLKPENILVAADGRTRLSDMGLAVLEVPGLRGIAGTPGYCAPEMLLKMEYGCGVDWWSFGCLLFELVHSTSPFRTEAAVNFGGGEDKSANIKKATMEMVIEWPADFSPHFRDLCARLLERDPARRLGARGATEIADHAFFKCLDWTKMRADEPYDDGDDEAPIKAASGEDEVGSRRLRPPEAPPIVPGKSLNIEDADNIGDFDDLGDAVSLAPEDFPDDKWKFVSTKAFQSEVVWLLAFRKKHNIAPKQYKSGACVLL